MSDKNKVTLSDDALDQVSGGSRLNCNVQPGMTWDDLEKEYHIPKELIATWNGLNPNQPLPSNTTVKLYY